MDLTQYDVRPRSQVAYLSNFGPHFNKALCEFAVDHMYIPDEDGSNDKPIEPYTKREVDEILASNKITLKKNKLYDYVFVANMAKADYMGKGGCLQSDSQLAKYIKNTIDDPDAEEGVTFARWLATMAVNGIPIEWSEILQKS